MDKKQRIKKAIMIIESEGNEGIHTCIDLVGEEMTYALYTQHHRYLSGSLDGSWPPDPKIEESVDQALNEIWEWNIEEINYSRGI